MARTFASGEFVNHGSAASLDTLPNTVGEMTVWAWVYRTAAGDNQHIITKDDAYPSGLEFGLLVDETSKLRFLITRATTFTDVISVTATIPANQWIFCAATFDEAAGTRAKLYVAPLNAAPVEPAYDVQDNGSGAISATTGTANLYVGNLQRGTANFFPGRIARGGVIARALTAAQITALHLASLAIDPTDANVADTRLLFDYDGADLTDHSGNSNAGTATGTTIVDHAPLLGSPEIFFEQQAALFDSPFGAMTWNAATGRLHAFGLTGTSIVHRYSDNEGATWSAAVTIRTLSDYSLYRLAAVAGGRVFIFVRADTTNYLYRSLDDGATWEAAVALGGHTASIDDRVTIAAHGSVVHILVGKAGVANDSTFVLRYWRSTDGGESFVNSGNPVILVPWEDEAANSGPSPGGLIVDGDVVHLGYAYVTPADGSLPYRARYKRSTDGGATWGSPVDISGAGTSPQIRPRAAVRDGRVLVFWEEATDYNQGAAYPNGARSEIRGNLSLDGGATWSGTYDLTSYGQEYLNHPEANYGPGGLLHLGFMVGPSQADQENVAGTSNYRLSTDYGATFGVHEVIDDRPTVYGIQNIWRSQDWVHVLGNGVYSRRQIVELTPATEWFFLDSTTGGWPILQMGGVDPTEATTGTGWDVTGLAAGQFARMEYGVIRTPATFSGTAQPSGGPDNTLKDAWRSATPLTGDGEAGDWTFQIPLIAVSGEGADARLRFRAWRSTNADGSGATEITSGAVTGTSVATLQDDTHQISSVTVALPALSLSNEYLFVQVALETV